MNFSPRHKALLLAALGLLLGVAAGLQVAPAITRARGAALADAGQAIVRAAAPRVAQRRVSRALQDAVARLVREPGLALNYVTVANAAGVTLVSRGRLAGDLGWRPARQARQWRGWLYRLRSAEATRPLRRNGRRTGSVRYGVAWLAVFARAGLSLPLGLAVLACGLLTFGVGTARVWRVGPAGGYRPVARFARQDRPALDRPLSRLATERSLGKILLRFSGRLPRRGARDDGFAPISDEPAAGRPETASRPAAAATLSGVPEHGADAEAADSAPRPPFAKSAASTDGGKPRPSAAPAGVASAADAAPTAAPRAWPELGDTTLDLRFFPIWRGIDRRTLAGAWAGLAWRSGAGETVDAVTLTQLAEKNGALRAFTQWIVQRFSMLHGNWRTLELATVPILLPIPSALLAFADAEAVWRTALRRVDRDPGDLILRVKQEGAPGPPLPVRRALGLNTAAASPPAGADIVCVVPEMLAKDAAAVVDRLDRLRRPVLFGPVAEPEPWAAIIEKDSVCWFSDMPGPDDPHTPRSFGRLLASHATAPI